MEIKLATKHSRPSKLERTPRALFLWLPFVSSMYIHLSRRSCKKSSLRGVIVDNLITSFGIAPLLNNISLYANLSFSYQHKAFPKFVPQFYSNLVEVTSGLVSQILEVNFLLDSAFASWHLQFGVLMAMYIRVKRNKTTYFIQCDPTETTLDIKQKLCPLIEQPVDDQRLSLVATNEMLDDAKTLADQKVENDAVVALSLRKGAGDNDFEDVYIAKPDLTSFS